MSISTSVPHPPSAPAQFRDIASTALATLRTAISALCSEVPGGVRKSYVVNKFLGVDARLSWQIFKLTGPGEALSLVPHVPLPAAMRRLLAAAKKHGVDPARVEAVQVAFNAFENLVEQHAGDRTTFDTMTRGFSVHEASQQTDVLHRKAIFKGHRHYLGAELETHVTTVINAPTARADKVNIGLMQSKLGIRRLRADSEMIVDSPKIWNTGDGEERLWISALDPIATQQYGASLIPEFCTHPVPALKVNDGADGRRITTLGSEVVGRQSAVDLVFGNLWRDIPFLSPDAAGRQGFGYHLYMNTPTIRLYMDVLVPVGQFLENDAHLEVFGFAPVFGDIEQIKQSQPRLHFREKIQRLAGGVHGAQLREVPQYLEMLNGFCARVGCRAEDFDIFRLAVEYPMMGSLISLRFNAKLP